MHHLDLHSHSCHCSLTAPKPHFSRSTTQHTWPFTIMRTWILHGPSYSSETEAQCQVAAPSIPQGWMALSTAAWPQLGAPGPHLGNAGLSEELLHSSKAQRLTSLAWRCVSYFSFK